MILGVIVACIPVIHPDLSQSVTFILRLSSKLGSWSRSRRTTNEVSTDFMMPTLSAKKLSSGISKTKPSESQVDRKNFKKLYNHLYPISDLREETQLTTCAAKNPDSGIRSKDEEIGHKGGKHVEVVRAWDVQYSTDS